MITHSFSDNQKWTQMIFLFYTIIIKQIDEDCKKDFFFSYRNRARSKWLCHWINLHRPVIHNAEVGWVAGLYMIYSAEFLKNRGSSMYLFEIIHHYRPTSILILLFIYNKITANPWINLFCKAVFMYVSHSAPHRKTFFNLKNESKSKDIHT